MKSEYNIIADIITEGSKVLDVGCDDGTLMEFLKISKNVNVRGIEISKQKVQTSWEEDYYQHGACRYSKGRSCL